MRMDRSNTGQPETRGVGRSYQVDQAAELWRDCVGISLSIPATPKIGAVWRNIRSFSARFALKEPRPAKIVYFQLMTPGDQE
jgi:hypothetical protein